MVMIAVSVHLLSIMSELLKTFNAQWNYYLTFIFGQVDRNIEVRKMLNGDNWTITYLGS
jgi:hypothetical protein